MECRSSEGAIRLEILLILHDIHWRRKMTLSHPGEGLGGHGYGLNRIILLVHCVGEVVLSNVWSVLHPSVRTRRRGNVFWTQLLLSMSKLAQVTVAAVVSRLIIATHTCFVEC